jgi:radical SAM superfamily enzyme YgiQ (UPF0313 family)
MARIDCLFLHVPKLISHYRPLGEFMWINFLPMGLLGLADLLHRNDISTQIVHMGVEWIQDPRFSLLDDLREKDPRIIAVDLHWHPQSFDVMEIVKKIKADFPSVYIVLGGYTASVFHEEIVGEFEAVDGIIRGEAEIPLLELTRAVLRGEKDFFSIPNLTWRRKKRVMVNPLSYAASEKDLNGLRFTHFPLLKNYPTYIRYISQPFYVKGLSKEKNSRIFGPKSPVFQLTVGRGCPVQCTWCGGGFLALKTITGREEVVFRDVEEVLQTIKEAVSYGYESLSISFDPYPHEPDYYLRLFSRIREEKLKLECFFESFGLPTADFISSFKKTFPGKSSRIILSPDVGSVKLRRIHKGYAYTNRSLMECLDRLKENRVSCELFFTLGVPFEKEEDLKKTAQLQGNIRKRFSNVKAIRTFILEMEPGSPWHLDPEMFEVETPLRTFMDFYRYHGSGESPLGYWIPDYFKGEQNASGFEKALQEVRCRKFCSMQFGAEKSFTPFWGRKLCGLSSLIWRVKGLVEKKG